MKEKKELERNRYHAWKELPGWGWADGKGNSVHRPAQLKFFPRYPKQEGSLRSPWEHALAKWKPNVPLLFTEANTEDCWVWELSKRPGLLNYKGFPFIRCDTARQLPTHRPSFSGKNCVGRRPNSLFTKRRAFLRQRMLLPHSPDLTPIPVVVINYLSKTHSGERGWGKPQWQRSRSLGPLVTVPGPTRSRQRRPGLFAYSML